MPDYIHMLVSISHERVKIYGVSEREKYQMIFNKHTNLKYKYENQHFWAKGYYVGTVGLNEATIVGIMNAI